jgi:hypothetical protein
VCAGCCWFDERSFHGSNLMVFVLSGSLWRWSVWLEPVDLDWLADDLRLAADAANRRPHGRTASETVQPPMPARETGAGRLSGVERRVQRRRLHR